MSWNPHGMHNIGVRLKNVISSSHGQNMTKVFIVMCKTNYCYTLCKTNYCYTHKSDDITLIFFFFLIDLSIYF